MNPKSIRDQYLFDGRHIGRLRKRDNLLKGEGGKRRGKEPTHTTAKKAWI
jgi:hypothetical protein